MVGNNNRTLRSTVASPASRQLAEATTLVDSQRQTFDTGTIAEETQGAPPSSYPRVFDSNALQDRQRSASPSEDADERPISSGDENEDDEETLRRTFEKLAKQQRIDGYKEKIRLMQQGIKIPDGTVGEPAVVPLAIASEAPVTYREPTPNLTQIPDYTAMSVKDHQEWERTWHRLHAVSPAYYQRDANKINVAATKLKGPIADAWEREEKTVDPTAITWRYFCDFLLNFIDDPQNRHSTMYRAWRKCTQRADEDLHTYYQRLETIQSEIPELTEEIKKIHLLSTIRPGLRRRLLELQYERLPRIEILKIGASLERNAEGDSPIGVKKSNHQHAAVESTVVMSQPYKRFKTREGNSTPRGGRKGYHQSRGGSTSTLQRDGSEKKPMASSPNNIPIQSNRNRERKPLSEMECYECHKKGHLKPNCPELKQRVAGASKASHQTKNGKASQ